MILRHPVTIFVTDFTNSHITNDLCIINSLIYKQIISSQIMGLDRKSLMLSDNKIKQDLFIFNTREFFNDQKRLLSLNFNWTY